MAKRLRRLEKNGRHGYNPIDAHSYCKGNTMRTLLFIFLLLLGTECLAAPLPFPKYPHKKFSPGFKFRYWNYGMEVYHVNEAGVYFQGIKTKYRAWTGGNHMSFQELERILQECPQHFIPDNN
jgi:hypothetical protein